MWQLDLDFSQPLPEQTPTAVTASSDLKPWSERVKLNRDGSRKLEDFGEDLGNTRKGQSRAAHLGNLEGIRDRLTKEPLEKVWPKDSILKMQNTSAAALLWLVRESFPTRRPMKKYQLQSYVDKASACVEFQNAVESGELTTDRLLELSPKMLDLVYEVKEAAKFLEVTDRQNWEHLSRNTFIDAMKFCRWNNVKLPNDPDMLDGKMRILMPRYSIPREESFYGYHVIEASTWAELGSQIDEHLRLHLKKTQDQQQTQEPKPVRFMYQTLAGGKFQILAKRGAIELALEEVSLSSRSDLYQYIQDNSKALTQKYDEMREELSRDEYSYKTNLIRDRVGTDWRGKKDVTPEQFEEVFGFRGVEFGNWVSQGKNSRERQWMLNNAFDAFNDLAELLHLPPKAMALDGSLGLAFGSRGHGKASAHYEPTSKVINLTKTKGYSSLAHEWFHALDHYIAASNSKDLSAFQSNYGHPIYKLKAEARERIYNAHDPEFAQSLLQSIENRVTNIHDTIFKNKDEASVSVCGASNVTSQLRSFRVEVTKDDFEPQYPDLLSTTIRPELYHAWRETIETIRSTRMSDRTKSRALKKGKAERSVEEDYWYSKIEQAARSFEGFVEAKLTKEGKVSDFLTRGSYSDETIENDGNHFFPYLDGDDIERVSEKFAKVFDVIKTRQTEKGVMLFSKLVNKVEGLSVSQTRNCLANKVGRSVVEGLENNGLLTLAEDENMAYVEAMLRRAVKEGKAKVFEHPVELSKINKKTKYVVNDDLATLDNKDGRLATISFEGKRGFPDGALSLRMGFHNPLKHNGAGARHLTGNMIEDPKRNLFKSVDNKTEAGILSCLEVIKSCSQIHRINQERFAFYSKKLHRAVIAVYDEEKKYFSITTDTPVESDPERLFGNLWVKNKGFISITKSPEINLGADLEVTSGVLVSPELDASTALPPSKLQRADPKVETRPNLDIGITSSGNFIKKEMALDPLSTSKNSASTTPSQCEQITGQNKVEIQSLLGKGTTLTTDSINNLYEDVDYTETVLRQIELAKAKALNQSTLDSAQGFYDPLLKRSFLIADNLTEDTTYPVLLHEVGVHMAHDSILHDKFVPVIDQAVQIMNDGLAQNDPLAQAVKNRLDLVGISSEDENYKEEVCAHLVEEVAKQELQKPHVVQWFNQVKSTINTWLVEHGWKDVQALSASDIATIAKNNVRELSKLKLEQAFTLVPKDDYKTDLMLSSGKKFPMGYQDQKEVLDQVLPGTFVVPGYSEQKTTEIGTNISLRDAIKEAKYRFEEDELDNIAFIEADTHHELPVDEALARSVAKHCPLQPKIKANQQLLDEYREVANIMGNEVAQEYLDPILKEIMKADRQGDVFNSSSQTHAIASMMEKNIGRAR